MSSNSLTFSSQNDTVNIKLANRGRDGNESTNNIYLRNDDGGYGKHNDDNNAQYLVTSNNEPNKLSSTENANLILKYIKEEDENGKVIGGKIDWVKDLETLGEFPNKISDTITRTLPIGDFFTDVQTNVDNFNSSTNNPINEDEADTKYKWVNLSGTVIDVGLNQLTWNTNKQYYFNETTDNSVLHIECTNEIDTSLGLKINYIVKDGDTLTENTIYYTSISEYDDNKLSCFKVNSIELIPTGDRTYNINDIEFYFKPGGQRSVTRDLSENFRNGISKLTFHNPSDGESCFSYNCDYLNCQYYNMYYNRNRSLRLTRELQEINTEEFVEVDFSDFISDYVIEGDYANGTVYELEGGRGRKAEITIKNASTENNESIFIKITNPGYLYQNGDLLRIKDRILKNLIFFTVTDTDSENINLNAGTKFTQEYIKANHGRSNTVKYCLDSNNCLLLKELNISGSTNSKILVRLIEVSKPLKYTVLTGTNLSEVTNKERTIQKVIREFYYFNRASINDIHHINKLIKPESEIFIDVQKLLENNDSDDKIDTLTFTINGIKIKTETEKDSSNVTSGFIMQRTV